METKKETATPPSSDPTQDAPPEQPEVSSAASFASHLDEFIERIDSLASTLPLAMMSVNNAKKKYQEDQKSFRVAHCELLEEGENTTVYSVPIEKFNELKRLDRKAKQMRIAQSAVPRSFLVAYISEYDAFLSGLLKLLFVAKPELLSSSEKQFSYAQIVEFDSIAAVREHVVEKEVETVLRKSHSEQFNYMESRFSVTLKTDLPVWPEFVELTERRNLFVHNSGRVNAQYLDVCRDAGYATSSAKGSELDVPLKYFQRAHAIVFEIAFKLTQVLWRKQLPDQRETADKQANRTVYDLVFSKRYSLAITLADFIAKTLDRYFVSDYSKRVAIVNRAQAYKWSGDESKCLAILNNVDWSASKEEFQLPLAALRNDFKHALELMRQAGTGDPLAKVNYREWPVFRELRQNKEFQDLFEELFNEPLNVIAVNTSGRNAEVVKEAETPIGPDAELKVH